MTATILRHTGQRDSDGPRPRHLPAPLINARAAVLNRQFCQDLSRTARKVLYGVLAFYTLGRPDKPIFAFRETLLPETLLDSRASLYRGLQEAETKGYLRREQVRNWGTRCYGQFGRSHIYLLEKALVMLGLELKKTNWPISPQNPEFSAKNQSEPDFCENTENGVVEAKTTFSSDATSISPEKDYLASDFSNQDSEGRTGEKSPAEATVPIQPIEIWEAGRSTWEDNGSGWENNCAPNKEDAIQPSQSYPQTPCITVRHGIQESEPTLNLQLKGQLPTRLLVSESFPVKDSVEKTIDPKTRLPHDVVPLLKLGVSKTLICTLMAYAKQQGQQGVLGAAVKLFWKHIEPLRGRSVFAYLRTVLSQKRDFAYMLKQKDANEVDGKLTTSATSRLTEKVSYLLQRSHGYEVRNAEGRVIGAVRSDGKTGYVEGIDPVRGRFAMPINLRFMQAIEEGRYHLRQAMA